MKDQETSKKSRRSTGAVTLRDVAKLAGVAPITASRAVNNPEAVSVDLLKRVQEAIDRTGYVPNRLAGGLASSRSRLIASVVPTLLGSVFLEMVEALNNTLFEAGYQLMLGQSGYSKDHEEALLDAIIGRRPDGIFLTGIMGTGKGRTRLLASGIPVVETWDLTPTPVDMLIGFSHSEIGKAVASYMMQKGHRRFALILADDERAARRATAFSDAVMRSGLAEPVVVNVGGDRSIKSGREALGRVLSRLPDVEAIFCSSDMLATGVVTEAAVRGIRVPNQLAVMGFGDVPFVADLIPALSTVHINGTAMGQQAARLLIARAEGNEVDDPIRDVGFSIVERDSA